MGFGFLLSLLGVGLLFGLFDGSDSTTDTTDPDPTGGPEPVTTGFAQGTEGEDAFDVSGNAVVTAQGGDDSAFVSDTATVRGGAGDDILDAINQGVAYGDTGADEITAADSAQAFGGFGDDTITASDDAIVQGNDGDDDITVTDGASASGDDGDDTITATGADFSPDATGTPADSATTLAGGEGDDFVKSTRADDTIYGGLGDDTIIGMDQNNLLGGKGNDLIVAGSLEWANSDVTGDGHEISGGAGADTIVGSPYFADADEVTVINDFNPDKDVLGVHLEAADIAKATITVTPSLANGWTDVIISLPARSVVIDGVTSTVPQVLTLRLDGVTSFDKADLVYYKEDATTGSYAEYTPAA